MFFRSSSSSDVLVLSSILFVSSSFHLEWRDVFYFLIEHGDLDVFICVAALSWWMAPWCGMGIGLLLCTLYPWTGSCDADG